MVAVVQPPWRRQCSGWSLVVVTALVTIGLLPLQTSALQGRYLDSISPQQPPPQPSRLNSAVPLAETSSSPPLAASSLSSSNGAPVNDGSRGTVLNGVENTDLGESSSLPTSTTTATARPLRTTAVTGSYLDSLNKPFVSFSPAADDDTPNGVSSSAVVAEREESLGRNEFVETSDTLSPSSPSPPYSLSSGSGDLSYADWLAAQYQNPSTRITPATSQSTLSSPQQPQQHDPYSKFSMNGDGTIPQSTDRPSDGVLSSSRSLTMASGDNTSAGGFTSEVAVKGDDDNDAVPTTLDISATAKSVENETSDEASRRSAAVVTKNSPAVIRDAYFAIPRRPDDPPPLPRLKSKTQSYSDQQQQPKETPFFISGVSDVPGEDSISSTPQNVLPKPLQSIFDSQMELMSSPMMEDIAERTRELISPIGAILKENVNENGKYLRKHARLMVTGGVSIHGDIEGERKAPQDLNTVGMTERIMKSIPLEPQATGAGGASTWEAFQNAEASWARLKHYMPSRDDPVPPPFVTENRINGNFQCYKKLEEQKGKKLDYDIVVCGGTLGIFFATALQLQGHRVCLVEAGKVRGREQEWNISMDELLLLKKLGILSQEDIDETVKTEFPGCRAGFKNREIAVEGGYIDNGIGFECFAEGVLNLGVSPAMLLERVSNTFKSAGGVIKEDTRLSGIAVETDVGAALLMGQEEEPVTARLVIDAMGNNSPITRQQRYGMKPDGVCVVVGSCASGFDAATNTIGDIIYTNTPIQDKGDDGGKMQYFWEAFPVGIGRDGKAPGTSDVKTTYMFTYIDADQRRPTLESLMEDYWRLLPQYQPSISNPETDLDVRRVLFAYFPTYRQSPLQSQFSRILSVGDASGIQSPLSFGGFGALTRHLERITTAVTEAMDLDILNKENLAYINPYTPNLSATWMFQKAMSVRMGQPFVDRRFVNRLLATNFEAMYNMGDRTLKPFLQDVVRFDGLVASLGKSFVSDPTFMPQIVGWVGVPTIVDWVGHVGMMGLYAGLDNFLTPILRPVADATLRNEETRYRLHRQMDAWRYGSGNDYDVNSIPKG